MSSDPLETSERLIFDGFVSGQAALVLGAVLAAAAIWLMWLDRKTLGTAWASLFCILRITAISLALWMLAGPMQETIERTKTTQSIAIFADTSGSMDVIDPPVATDLLRWNLAGKTKPTKLGHCDSIKVAIQMASTACEQTNQALKEHRPLKQLQKKLNKARLAVNRAKQHCNQLIEQLEDEYEDFGDRIERVATLLNGPVTTACEDLQAALEDRSTTQVHTLTDTLETLSENISNTSRRMDVLTRELAEVLAESSDHLDNSTQELTRRERTMQTLDALSSLFENLDEEIQVRKFHFDSTLTPVSAQQNWNDITPENSQSTGPAQNTSTDITAMLKQLSTDRTTHATRLAFLLTDGNHTALGSQAPQEIATQISELPIFPIAVGNSDLVRDLRIHRVEAPATVVEKDTGIIEAIVTATDCDGLATTVTLRHDGQDIDQKTIAFTGNRMDRRIQFSVPADQVGWQDYELLVEALPDEEGVANNVAPISWEVVRDKFRVLLADGRSHWGFQYLHNLFQRDSHIEWDELLFYPRLRGTGEMATNPRLPESVDDWAVYDIVILGDLGVAQFSQASQESLVEYVRNRNGHLILIAGREHMPHEYIGKPLIDLLPVTAAAFEDENEGYTLHLTDEGRLHNALAIEDSLEASELAWQSIYRRKPIFRLSEYSRPKPTARTLLRAAPTRMAVVVDDRATNENLPAFLSWHQVGGGRVAYLAAAETWKLRFRAEDRRHHRFWGQLLRWITAEDQGSGTELIRLSTNKKRYHPKEPIEVTAWLKDQTGRPLAGQTLQAAVHTLNNQVASADLESDPEVAGRYFCTLDSLPAGAYEIRVEGNIVDQLLSTSEEKSAIHSMISIDGGENLEMLDTRCDRALLEQVAEITGGQVVPPTAIAEVLKLASLSPEVNETIQRTPVWNRWANLWIVLSCLMVEWIVRKKKGLV